MKWLGPPSPLFSVTAYSKGLTGVRSVSADSEGLICTKIVHNSRPFGTAHSKGVREIRYSQEKKKTAEWLPLGVGLPKTDCNSLDSGCQGKRERAGKKIAGPVWLGS